MRLLPSIAILATTAVSANAAVVGQEDFDGGAINLSSTSNVLTYDNLTLGDVFARVSKTTGMPFDVADDSVADVSSGTGANAPFAGDTLGIAGQNTTAFFAVSDADGATTPNNNAVWTFDISSAVSITSITIDIAAMGDFEASSTDGFLIEATIDGGTYAEIFKGRTDEAVDKLYRAFDDGDTFTLNDPLKLSIDGVETSTYLDKSDPTTGDFDTYTSTLLAGQSGSTLSVRLSWAGTPSGSEPVGIDNIVINGVIPEPATLGLLGLAGLAMGRRRR